MKRIILTIAFLLTASAQVCSQSFWHQTHGPYGGAQIYDILHYNDSTFFLASKEGLIKSSDNGNTWLRISPNDTKITSLALDSTGWLYAGENFSANNFFVIKSTDGGNTWNRLNFYVLAEVKDFLITYSDTLYICTWGRGIYRSIDRGINWELKNNGIEYLNIHTMIRISNGDLVVGSSGGGVYKSSDDGNSWVQRNSGIPANGAWIMIYSLLEVSPGKIIAGTHDGIYYSDDYGNTWIRRNSGVVKGRANSIIKDDSGTLYSGMDIGDGVYISIDNGLNWTQWGLQNFSILKLYLDLESNVFCGTISDGLFKRMLSDTVWVQIYNQGYTPLSVYKLEINPYGSVITAATSLGVFISTNQGQYWVKSNYYGGTINFIKSINDSCFIAGSGSVYFSSDNGYKWETKLNAPGMSIFFDTTDNTIYLGSIPTILQSVDLGNSWREIYSFGFFRAIIGIYVTKSAKYLLADVLSPSYPNSYSWFYRSTDKGQNWELKLTNIFITQINEDTYGNLYALGNAFYISEDSGNTWNQSAIGGRKYFTIDSQDRIFSASPGVYYSIDQAKTWYQISSSGILGGINDIKVDKNSTIYLATSNGIYIGDGNNIVTVNNEILRQYSYKLSQNYPNPFNPGTKISWQSPVSSHQVLKVFDVLGREVTTLVNEYKDAGYHEVEFNAAGLSSGVYFYRIQAGDYVETKKMVLLR